MINLTNEQKAVVNAPIGNMLVSAAAGSGKTSVLVERILTKLIQGAFNIDDILVTDFTGGNPSVAKPVFTPSAGQYFGPVEVIITCDTPGADIYYTTDGSDPTQSSNYYTAPVNISSTTTLKARAYAENLDPSSITQGTYNIAEVIEVANLGELRDLYSGGTEYFKVTSEVIVTFTQPFRNQKYIEDATAAILIDDLSGTIVTEYNIGDGITGIVGSITAFGNMLQFNPAFDPGAPTSTGNAILPQVITIEEMLANFEEYESELVKINGVTFSDAGEEFANGVVSVSYTHLTLPTIYSV